MKLSAWLSANNVSDEDFAARIKTSRQAVWRYKADRIPKRDIMQEIIRETGGEVQPIDFYEVEVLP